MQEEGPPRTEQESRYGGIQCTYSLFDTIIRNTNQIFFQTSGKNVKRLVWQENGFHIHRKLGVIADVEFYFGKLNRVNGGYASEVSQILFARR